MDRRGLRAITAKQEDNDSAEAVEAEQDGLGGVVSLVTGAAVILARGGFCLARRRGRAFCLRRLLHEQQTANLILGH